MYVIVHNNSYIPLTKYEGVKAQAGTTTDIGITRTFVNRLPSPYSSCRKDVSTYSSDDSFYYKYILTTMNNMTKYTQKLCYQVCYQDLVNQQCNCTEPSNTITLNANLGLCSTDSQSLCVTNALSSCFKSIDTCSCHDYCPTECDSITYTTSISSSYYVFIFKHYLKF